MPGAWELKDQYKVFMYSIHVDTTTIAWAVGFKNLIIPGTYQFYAGMPYDHARNTAVQQFLASPCEWLFSLDTDVIPPPNAILRLLSHGKPFISGVYHRRSPPHGLPVMIKGGGFMTAYPPNSLIEVDYVGAGCLLIHRSVLERLPPHPGREEKRWFDWRVDLQNKANPPPREECLSEDFVLCRRVKRELGIPVLVDTGCVCKHVGHAEFMYNNTKPLELPPPPAA